MNLVGSWEAGGSGFEGSRGSYLHLYKFELFPTHAPSLSISVARNHSLLRCALYYLAIDLYLSSLMKTQMAHRNCPGSRNYDEVNSEFRLSKQEKGCVVPHLLEEYLRWTLDPPTTRMGIHC